MESRTDFCFLLFLADMFLFQLRDARCDQFRCLPRIYRLLAALALHSGLLNGCGLLSNGVLGLRAFTDGLRLTRGGRGAVET